VWFERSRADCFYAYLDTLLYGGRIDSEDFSQLLALIVFRDYLLFPSKDERNGRTRNPNAG
jgi:hypothetical protein